MFKRIIAFFVIVTVLLGTGIGIGFMFANVASAPSLNTEIDPDASSQILDINGKLIGSVHAVENRLPVTIDEIPQSLQDAFVATEDARFYEHFGIDIRSIFRAIWANISSKGISEGASTITQQLARNALLTHEQTFKRKLYEILIALQIEHKYTKKEILTMYLNQIYFGAGAYGVEAASQVYFGKSVKDLNLAECALLAGIPKSPNYYSPFNNLEAAQERQAVVLEQMVKYGYIKQEKADETKKIPIKLAPASSKKKFASYFIEYITASLIDKYGADAVYKSGLKIYTTLSVEMQKAAEEAMEKLPSLRTDANNQPQPQGALIAIDPHTGYIKAMVGGRGTDQFNRATMAVRQPGSAFKPFVYLTALQNGLTANTIINDVTTNFGNYTPGNYDQKTHGAVSMRVALEKSYNIPAVKVANQVGVSKVLDTAKKMGITTLVFEGSVNDNNLSSALGGLSRGVYPIELAAAYGALANDGKLMKTTAIIKVVDQNGKILEEFRPEERTVADAKAVYTLIDIMKGVITRGSGGGANIDRPAAGKTGTTSDYIDAWFVGFTPDLVAAVWMGNDDNKPLPKITGADYPATIWQAFMNKAVANMPPRDFTKPSGFTIDETAKHLEKATETAEEPNKKDAAKDGADKASGKDGDKPSTSSPAKATQSSPATETKASGKNDKKSTTKQP